MAKDREGKFTPAKGKPSGSGKNTTGLRDAFAGTDPETDENLTEKYMDGPDQPAANVPLRHVNRNVNKGEDTTDNANA
jgi:hypothetical protein